MVFLATSISNGTDYEIRIEGHLGTGRSRSFDGFQIKLTDAGETVIRGEIRDQAALHAILARIRDLGVTLISVRQMGVSSEYSSGRGQR